MVRSNLRPWLGLAGFILLVGTLAAIALGRVGETPSLEGRWTLVSVETPEGTLEPEGDADWIEFDGTTFTGHMECVDFEGDFTGSGGGGFALSELGWSSVCVSPDGTG